MDNEFERDVSLDINLLHEEWQKQAQLYGKWARRLAKAVKEKFKLDERLKVIRTQTRRRVEEVRAELDSLIRKDYGECGFDKKPTEAAITGWILLQPKFKKVQDEGIDEIKIITDELADAIEREELFKGACLAMSHKKSAIEGEVKLWSEEYFSDPMIPKSLKENIQKETQAKVRKRLSRK